MSGILAVPKSIKPNLLQPVSESLTKDRLKSLYSMMFCPEYKTRNERLGAGVSAQSLGEVSKLLIVN
jgi:hypothetical protein